MAAHSGHFEVVKFLIENGANAKTSYALRDVAYKQRDDVFDLLIENGADIKELDFNLQEVLREPFYSTYFDTPLQVKYVKWLIGKGAKISTVQLNNVSNVYAKKLVREERAKYLLKMAVRKRRPRIWRKLAAKRVIRRCAIKVNSCPEYAICRRRLKREYKKCYSGSQATLTAANSL
jgi:hypothetical protein